MKIKRVGVGFDLRINPGELGENRLAENQRLVPEIASPISADPNVWVKPGEIERLTVGKLPDFANPLGLAKSIDLLVDACKKRDIPTSGLWPVCVTSSEANTIALVERYGPGYFDNQPREEELLTSGWRFLGFDIVDLRGLISGLKGCGYSEPTWSQLQNYFRGDLNDAGLFKDHLTASEFAEVRAGQIREHSPFVVVGICKNQPL